MVTFSRTNFTGEKVRQNPITETMTTLKQFECVNPERNHNKFYKLTVDMLLFGPTITRGWGRIGSTGGPGPFQRTTRPGKRQRGRSEPFLALLIHVSWY